MENPAYNLGNLTECVLKSDEISNESTDCAGRNAYKTKGDLAEFSGQSTENSSESVHCKYRNATKPQGTSGEFLNKIKDISGELTDYTSKNVLKSAGRSAEFPNQAAGYRNKRNSAEFLDEAVVSSSGSMVYGCRNRRISGGNSTEYSVEAAESSAESIDCSVSKSGPELVTEDSKERVIVSAKNIVESKKSAGNSKRNRAESSHETWKSLKKSRGIMEKAKEVAQKQTGFPSGSLGCSKGSADCMSKTDQKLARKLKSSDDSTESEYKKCKLVRNLSDEISVGLDESSKSLEKSGEIACGSKETAQKLTRNAIERVELCSEQEYRETDNLMELTAVSTVSQQLSCRWNGYILSITGNRERSRSFLLMVYKL